MKKDLTPKEKIALVGIELLGREYLGDGFAMCHPKTKTESESSLSVMRSRWYASPMAKAFRLEIRAKMVGVATASGHDLTTREGVLSQLISSVKATSGKDSISGIQTLAKMQGFDRPAEESDQQERRTYFLPWVSNCRKCELMRIYIETQNKK